MSSGYLEIKARSFLLNLINNPALKRQRLLRALLHAGVSEFTNAWSFLSGLKFPAKWTWYSKIEFLLNFYEPGTTMFCKKIIKKGMYVLDVGANIGYYTLLFSKLVGNSGCVYAFEPEPYTFMLLKHNVKKRKNVSIFQKAMSNFSGEIEFLVSTRTRSHGLYVPKEYLSNKCKVKVIRGDDFLIDKKCDLIKIDVEGAEPFVIYGMSDFINNSEKITVIIEYCPRNLELGGVEPLDFINTLQSFFEMVFIIKERTGKLFLVNRTLLTEELSSNDAINLICIKGYEL